MDEHNSRKRVARYRRRDQGDAWRYPRASVDRATHLRIKRIMTSTLFVDEYFDELLPRPDDAETMSIEDACAMTLAAVREEYAQL